MQMSEPKIFDASEQLSKALDETMRSGTAAFVVKGGQLFGIIDDRNMRMGIADASRTRCESACVKCPSIRPNAGIKERLDAFLAGHFKALPVVSRKGKIIGATSRSDLLRELCSGKLIPHVQACQHMSRPAFTIDYMQTVGDAKSVMKKAGTHHLVVTRSGNIVGTLSTLDLTGLLLKPRERQSYQFISEVRNFDSLRIDEVMRPEVASIPETATLEEAAAKMAGEGVSSIVVVADRKPAGMLSATDIFKIVRRLFESEKDVLVSGLDADTLAYYGRIKEEVLGAASKFEKSLKIENLAVHIKKGKSVYEANMHFDLNNRPMAFRCEAYNLGDTIAALSKELKIMLEKAKSEKMERKKPPRQGE